MDAVRPTWPASGYVDACPPAPSPIDAVRVGCSPPDTYARAEAERILESMQVVSPSPAPGEAAGGLLGAGRLPLESFWRWLRPPPNGQEEPYGWVVEERDFLRHDNRRLRHALDTAQRREEEALHAYAALAREVDMAIEALRAPAPIEAPPAIANLKNQRSSVLESAQGEPAPVPETSGPPQSTS